MFGREKIQASLLDLAKRGIAIEFDYIMDLLVVKFAGELEIPEAWDHENGTMMWKCMHVQYVIEKEYP